MHSVCPSVAALCQSSLFHDLQLAVLWTLDHTSYITCRHVPGFYTANCNAWLRRLFLSMMWSCAWSERFYATVPDIFMQQFLPLCCRRLLAVLWIVPVFCMLYEADGVEIWVWPISVVVCSLSCVVIIWSSHKWTGTGPRTSVIWTWSNRIRDSIYACIRLLFAKFLTL